MPIFCERTRREEAREWNWQDVSFTAHRGVEASLEVAPLENQLVDMVSERRSVLAIDISEGVHPSEEEAVSQWLLFELISLVEV